MKEGLRVETTYKVSMEEISWHQKAKERWIKDGDRNTKFF